MRPRPSRRITARRSSTASGSPPGRDRMLALLGLFFTRNLPDRSTQDGRSPTETVPVTEPGPAGSAPAGRLHSGRWISTSSGRWPPPPNGPPSTRCWARRVAGRRRPDPAEGHVARGGHAARSRRDLLIPTLHAVQSRIGWISQPALSYVCRRLTVPPAEAYGVATFYALFSTRPRPPTVAHVCDDIACRLAGAEECRRPRAGARSGRKPSVDGRHLASIAVPRALRARAGGDVHDRRAGADDGGRGPVDAAGVVAGCGQVSAPGRQARGARAAGRPAGPPAPRPRRRRRPDLARRLPRPWRFPRPRARAGDRSGPGDRRGHAIRARRTWRRRVPDRAQVGRGRAQQHSPTTSSATPTSPSPARSRTGC